MTISTQTGTAAAPMDHTDPDAVYAYIRRHGQIHLGNPDDALVRRVRHLANRDGLSFAQYTSHPRRQPQRRYRTVSLALHDGQHNLVFPDAAPAPVG